MALVACPECGKKVSSTATTCPHCGFDRFVSAATGERPGRSGGCVWGLIKGTVKLVFLGFIGLIIITIVAGFFFSSNKPRVEPASPSVDRKAASTPPP